MIVIGAVFCALSGAAAWAFGAAGVSTVAAIAVPAGVFMFAFAFVVPAAMAAALSPFPQMIGRASSILGFCQFGSGTLMMLAIGAAADGTQMPMVAALAVTGIGSVVMCAAIPSARLAATNG
jgi:DHA1 family bicyclomycin/chloramphenicol resistance-like MFS transporter